MIDFHALGNEHYVYLLAYPESMGGAVFYAGKGQTYRITDHEREARKGHQCHKCNVIRDIWAHGEQVVKKIVAVFSYIQEREAFMYEWAIINLTSFAEQLVNKSSGIVKRKKTKRVFIDGRIVLV